MNSLISMDHLLLLPKVEQVATAGTDGDTHFEVDGVIDQWHICSAWKACFGLWGENRSRRCSFLHTPPLRAITAYPSNRTHSPPSVCGVGGRSKGASTGPPAVSCHCHHILIRFSSHVCSELRADNFMSRQGANSGKSDFADTHWHHLQY